jgi:hypothetical protein
MMPLVEQVASPAPKIPLFFILERESCCFALSQRKEREQIAHTPVNEADYN